MTLLTDEVKAWIGRDVVYQAPEELGRGAIRYFALAVGDDNPLYTDDSYARQNGYPSVIAPPTLVCETNQYMPGGRDRDGYIGHTWKLPITGCRMIRGGNTYEFHQPVLPTDRITARWTLEDITEREGSKPMLILTSRVTYTNQHGELLATNVETIIYQQVTP